MRLEETGAIADDWRTARAPHTQGARRGGRARRIELDRDRTVRAGGKAEVRVQHGEVRARAGHCSTQRPAPAISEVEGPLGARADRHRAESERPTDLGAHGDRKSVV